MRAIAAVLLVATMGSCGLLQSNQPQLSAELPTPTVISQAATPDIEPAAPTSIYIPGTDANMEISTVVKPMEPCLEVIDPPRDEGIGGVYYCTDFALPGSHSEGKTVIAGHASAYIDTWFNRLQAQGQSLLNERVYIQTASSGDLWLQYAITGVYQPAKDKLPYDTRVWGSPGESTSGRLVLVTCLIDSSGDSTANYVVVAELDSIVRLI